MSIGVYVNPGASVGTMNNAGFSLPVRASVMRATTRTWEASSTPEMYVLPPFSSQSSPSRRAWVVMRCELDPASGSVIENAIFWLPSARPGSQRRFCSGVPDEPMIVCADGRRHDDHQQRAAGRGELLAHHREVADSPATAAVLLGHGDADVAELADRGPQLVGLVPFAGAPYEVVAAETGGESGDRLAQLGPLPGLGERRAGAGVENAHGRCPSSFWLRTESASSHSARCGFTSTRRNRRTVSRSARRSGGSQALTGPPHDLRSHGPRRAWRRVHRRAAHAATRRAPWPAGRCGSTPRRRRQGGRGRRC